MLRRSVLRRGYEGGIGGAMGTGGVGGSGSSLGGAVKPGGEGIPFNGVPPSEEGKPFTWRDKLSDMYEIFRFRAIASKQKGAERFGKPHYNIIQWFQNRFWYFVGLCLMFTNYTYYTERGRRETIMLNLESNRRSFYGKTFENDYLTHTPARLYDGPAGYIQVDHETGIKTNADGKITAPPNKELAANLAKTNITNDMLDQIQELHETQYTEEGKRHPEHGRGQKEWTGFM